MGNSSVSNLPCQSVLTLNPPKQAQSEGLLPSRAWGHARYEVVTEQGTPGTRLLPSGARPVRSCYRAGHARYEARHGGCALKRSDAGHYYCLAPHSSVL